jgi:hypothetical protein
MHNSEDRAGINSLLNDKSCVGNGEWITSS